MCRIVVLEKGDNVQKDDEFFCFDDLYKAIKKEYDTLDSSHTIFFTDLAGFFYDRLDQLDKLIKDFDAEILYLVRHPLRVSLSYKQINDKLFKSNFKSKNKPEVMDNLSGGDHFTTEYLLKTYKKYPGYIMKIESFQEDPYTEMSLFFNSIGREFKEEYTKFKPLIQEQIPKDLNVWDLEWFDNVLNSSYVKKKVVSTDEITREIFNDNEEYDRALIQEKFYDEFMILRNENMKNLYKIKKD